jgi:hypothetical protein
VTLENEAFREKSAQPAFREKSAQPANWDQRVTLENEAFKASKECPASMARLPLYSRAWLVVGDHPLL